MDQHTPATHLPAWDRVLVVVAHPDDESFGLGAVIDKFTSGQSEVHVLTLTHGEASTLGGEIDDLAAERRQELLRASEILNISSVELRDWPDGGLEHADEHSVVEDIKRAIAKHQPDGLLVFERQGVNRHPDHAAATARARRPPPVESRQRRSPGSSMQRSARSCMVTCLKTSTSQSRCPAKSNCARSTHMSAR